jgi:membrane associated rhomboid family serine protease
MFPLRDNERSEVIPFVTWGLILINSIVFIYQFISADIDAFIYRWSLVPVNVDFSQAESLITFITSMFLHGGFWHFFSNMWFLRIFGDNVEGALGHIRYLIFYLIGGVIAAFVQYLFLSGVDIAILGASGAIAAVLGYYLIAFPHHRIDTVIIFVFIRVIRLPAQLVLGLWFVTQLFNGTSSVAINTTATSGVAWWAHIGGFVFGVLVALVLRKSHYKNHDQFRAF